MYIVVFSYIRFSELCNDKLCCQDKIIINDIKYFRKYSKEIFRVRKNI